LDLVLAEITEMQRWLCAMFLVCVGEELFLLHWVNDFAVLSCGTVLQKGIGLYRGGEKDSTLLMGTGL
jgi:hypothetical protein